jgi:hypothetical protein
MYIPLTFEGALQSCLYASGGFVQGFFISASQQYAFHVFNQTGSQQLQVLAGTLNNVKIAVVGGGGGGSDTSPAAGGGGGGGVIVQDNTILYAGTYTINVGKGGLPLDPGQATSIVGANLSLSAGGGNPGFGNVGGNSGTPNSFLGAAGTSAQGGGGGGAAGNAYVNGSSLFNQGGPGITSSFGGDTGGMPFPFSYGNTKYLGAGGNGDQSGVSDPLSLYGRGGVGIAGAPGASGGDGAVIIQYPINDYCKNFFNETGSCDCRQLVISITDNLNFYPNITGSYQYTPCGTNTFASGTLEAYWPVTLCAASNSWYWYEYTGSVGLPYIYSASFSGFVDSGAECFSASYGVQTCVTQSFTPTNCGSNLFYSASIAGTFFYVPTGSANINYYNVSAGTVGFGCISSGSVGSIGEYPNGLTGLNNTLSSNSADYCRNTRFTPGSGTQTYSYYRCDNNTQVIATTSVAVTVCARKGRPVTMTGIGSSIVDLGSGCMSTSTGSCGCP